MNSPTTVSREVDSSTGLQKLRRQIDLIDEMLLTCLEQRFRLTRLIGQLKLQTEPTLLPINPEREAQILQRLTSASSLPASHINLIWRAIFCLSAQEQKHHSVVVSGASEHRDALMNLALREFAGIDVHWHESQSTAIGAALAGHSIALIATTDASFDSGQLQLIGQYVLDPELSIWAVALGRIADPESGRSDWEPTSWQKRVHRQQPAYRDPAALEEVILELQSTPSLIGLAEVERLRERIGSAQEGASLILQAGDCAESITADENAVASMHQLIEELADQLSECSSSPVIRIGRIAGQFAKPRSQLVQRIGDRQVPIYRGDAVNGIHPSQEERLPQPQRMLTARAQARRVWNWLRARSNNDLDFAISHEALLLANESALTRRDDASGAYWNSSAHTVWLGERTRQLHGAHLEYLRGIANPIGIKCGPSLSPDHLVAILEKLNPLNEPGRIMLVTRLGVSQVSRVLCPLVEGIEAAGSKVAWLCDPMHGNTRQWKGAKTRFLADILEEIRQFVSVVKAAGAIPAGLHLEITPDDVTECVEDPSELGGRPYLTLCDPRLNRHQARECIRQFAAALHAGCSL